MKKYFEYPFNSEIEKKLINFYNNTSIRQHGDDQDKKMEIKLNRLNTLYNFSANDNVLDIGCSKGLFLRKIENQINYGVGIDISKKVIEENRKQYTTEKLSFFDFDGKNIPNVVKASVIVMLDVLEHAFEPDALINSVGKIANQDTAIIIEVPFSGWFSEMIAGKYHEGHLRYYDTEYLRKYLTDHGFTVEKIKTYNSVMFSGFFTKYNFLWKILNYLVNLVPSRFYPYFGEIILLARKNEK
ncbi:MAG: class I SAM-dependent methyltransferase [Patescibacteria group bacterium]|jgi:2-polyprenyl-3-methyl-5-hydroxy-6-metoxy-1,4-benzoquinol methylase